MTAREFIHNLTKNIEGRSAMDEEYTAADLTKDAATAGLWYRKPYPEERQEAIAQARNEVEAKPTSER